MGKIRLDLLARAIKACLRHRAKGMRTYSGKFKSNVNPYSYGEAIYSYRENPEGGRIYEGRFSFVEELAEGGSLRVEGHYKNNRKEGLWIVRNGTQTLKEHYRDGVLNGAYTYRGKGMRVSLTLKGNRIVGIATVSGNIAKISASGTLRGQFADNGQAEGTWILDTTPYHGTEIYRTVYTAGRQIQSTVEDITTGDIAALPPEEAADKGDFAAIVYEAVKSQRPLADIISRGAAPFNLCESAR